MRRSWSKGRVEGWSVSLGSHSNYKYRYHPLKRGEVKRCFIMCEYLKCEKGGVLGEGLIKKGLFCEEHYGLYRFIQKVNYDYKNDYFWDISPFQLKEKEDVKTP